MKSSPALHGHSPAPTHLQKLNLQMTQSSWLVHVKHYLDFFTSSNTWLLELDSYLTVQNAPSLSSTVLFQSLSLSLSMLTHTEPVTVHIVRLSFKCHSAKIPLTPPCNPCKVRNTLDPSLPLLHPQSRMSTFDVPGLLRLQDSGSDFSSPTYFSKIQTSGFHTNSAGHSPSWI